MTDHKSTIFHDRHKKMMKSCKICSEHKQQFFRSKIRTMKKPSQPFERLNIDFKGFLPAKKWKSLYVNFHQRIFAILISISLSEKISKFGDTVLMLFFFLPILGFLLTFILTVERLLSQSSWDNFFMNEDWPQAGRYLTNLRVMANAKVTTK